MHFIFRSLGSYCYCFGIFFGNIYFGGFTGFLSD